MNNWRQLVSTVQFLGYVTPPTYHVTLPFLMMGQWKDDDVDYDVKYKISIKDNIVIANCEVNNYVRATHLSRMLLRALNTSQAAVDLVAFSLGAPLAIVFESASEHDGSHFPLHVRDPDLAALVTAFSLDTPKFQQALKIVIEERNLFHALRDLIEATSAAHKVVPHCAKAIETVRTLLTPPESDRKEGWSLMSDNLRVDSKYLKLITDHSKAPRHGDHQAITAAITEEISKRSWTVMNRFLEFRMRGSQPLPSDQFPLLSGNND